MSQLQLALTIIGGLFALTAFAWVCIQLAKKLPSEAYDERQKQARGKAFEICYFVQILYTAFMTYWYGNPPYGKPGLSLSLEEIIVLGFLIQIFLFHICCLLQGAALPFSQKPWGTIFNYSLSCFTLLFVYFARTRRYSDQPAMMQGLLWLYLFAGAGALYIIILHLIQFFRNKRAEQE